MSGDHNMYGDGTVYRGERRALDRTASELQDTCHKQAQRIAALEKAARQALEALRGLLAIVGDSNAVAGYHLNGELEPWSGFPEVEEAGAAITALREALEQPQKTNQCGEVCERAKLCATCAQGLKPDQASEPVAWIANDWSVFNTGAEVASGLSLNDAMDYLTDERATRGWSVVCVINKDNMPTPATPQPTRQPLSDDWIRGMCKKSWVFDAAKQWIRIAERAHGIGEAVE